MKHFGLYRKLILILEIIAVGLLTGYSYITKHDTHFSLCVSCLGLVLYGFLILLDYLHNRYTDDLLEQLTLLIESLVCEKELVCFPVTEYPSYLRLDISDNGAGISEEEQAKIFGRFYRGKQSVGIDGVGIGLHLARDIICKQNGYIKVSSDDKGSTFSFFLRKTYS